MKHRLTIAVLFTGLVGCGANLSVAEQPPPMVNPVGSDATVDPTLDALQERGKTLKEFVADLELTENNLVMGTDSIRTGKAWYQTRSGDDVRLRVVFDKRIDEGKPPKEDKRDYLLSDGWLTDRDYHSKTEVRRQVAAPGEKVNLFQVGKGPFPLPIGQDKKDVHGQFDVAQLPPNKDDPAETIHLQLKPKPNTDLARKFKMIDVFVDRGNNMPVRIKTIDINESMERQTDLKNLQVNPEKKVGDADFALPALGGDWNSHDEPMKK